MKHGKEEISELDRCFEHFLAELEKQPVNRSKAIEMEHQFLKAIHQNTSATEARPLSSDAFSKDPEIILDMDKLLRQKHLFKLSEVPENAARWASIIAMSAAGILFIIIGFFLIITPASPEFEIATIFYFNEYDGVTVMDLLALVIILIGIYFFIRAFIANDKS